MSKQLFCLASVIVFIFFKIFFMHQNKWGTAKAKRQVSSVQNPELSKVFLLKPGLGQNIAMHALPTVDELPSLPYDSVLSFVRYGYIRQAHGHLLGPRNQMRHPA